MKEYSSRPASVRAQAPAPLFPAGSSLEFRTIAWRKAGLVRNAASLESAVRCLHSTSVNLLENPDREDFERRNIHTVAGLIARSALAREESRGGHYRDDFPHKRPEFEKHSSLSKTSPIQFFEAG